MRVASSATRPKPSTSGATAAPTIQAFSARERPGAAVARLQPTSAWVMRFIGAARSGHQPTADSPLGCSDLPGFRARSPGMRGVHHRIRRRALEVHTVSRHALPHGTQLLRDALTRGVLHHGDDLQAREAEVHEPDVRGHPGGRVGDTLTPVGIADPVAEVPQAVFRPEIIDARGTHHLSGRRREDSQREFAPLLPSPLTEGHPGRGLVARVVQRAPRQPGGEGLDRLAHGGEEAFRVGHRPGTDRDLGIRPHGTSVAGSVR